jgi:hypothetical protein
VVNQSTTATNRPHEKFVRIRPLGGDTRSHSWRACWVHHYSIRYAYTCALLILDVVKTRIQTGTRSSPSKSTKIIGAQIPLAAGFASQPRNIGTESVVTALRHVYHHEGWKGLFRGMGPRSGWCGSQSGIMFLGYEFFLRILENWDKSRENTGS